MGHYYRFKRGDRVTILSGKYAGANGTVDSCAFQRTVDYPDEYAPGYHVVLDDGTVVTARWDQVKLVSSCCQTGLRGNRPPQRLGPGRPD